MDRQFLFTTEKIELKEEDGRPFVYGYISTSDKDLVNDIVTENCLKSMFNQMRSRVIKFDIEHESFRGDTEEEKQINKTLNPVAKVDWFGLDSNGLMVKAVLNKYHPRFEEVKGSISEGFLDAFSIAYIPTKSWKEEMDGQVIRKLDDLNILNVAFTGNPVNQKALMTDVFIKSLDALNENKERSDTMTEEKKNIPQEKAKEETKEEPKENLEVKNLESKLGEISVSLKSIEERVVALERKPSCKSEEEETESKPNPLEEQMKALQKELKELKSQPQYKSVQQDMKKELAEQIKSKTWTPLDGI